jgi:YD repeat-containing protein
VPDVIKFSSGTGPLETRIRFHQYDNKGNIIELSKENDSKTVYRWGYNQTYPVAVVKNTTPNEIFYTSFEDEEGGNSTDGDGKTGKIYKTDGFYKPLTGLTSNKDYWLSYWKKVSGAWAYYGLMINLNSSTTTYTINLTGQVDEIRFYPVGSLMTTYTYNPGIGITSVTDPNNQTIYYEYDNMGRLWLVKDHNGKIMKEHKYNYHSTQY